MITLFPQVKSLHHQLVSISEPRLVIFALLLFAPCSGCFVATVYQHQHLTMLQIPAALSGCWWLRGITLMPIDA